MGSFNRFRVVKLEELYFSGFQRMKREKINSICYRTEIVLWKLNKFFSSYSAYEFFEIMNELNFNPELYMLSIVSFPSG